MYSGLGFTDDTGRPGYHSRDQRVATHPGSGPRTEYRFFPMGLVHRSLYTERLKNACTLIAFPSDREVCTEHPCFPPSSSFSSSPSPFSFPSHLPTNAIGLNSRCSQWLETGGFYTLITLNWTLEHIKPLFP